MGITLGLVPASDDLETKACLEKLMVVLGERLGTDCRAHRAVSPAALAMAFEAGVVNLVWSSPTLALVASELRSAVPLVASVREGVAHYHGVIFVRKDSEIRSMLDLDGSTMGWVADTSAAGYIFPRAALASHGLDPDGISWEQSFFGSHGAVVLKVIGGAVDAGATFAVFEEGDATKRMIRAGFVDLEHEDEVRVLLSTPRIPADLFVASPALDEELGGVLAKALSALCVEMPEETRRVFGVDSLIPCEPQQLDELRRQLEDARALGVLGD